MGSMIQGWNGNQNYNEMTVTVAPGLCLSPVLSHSASASGVCLSHFENEEHESQRCLMMLVVWVSEFPIHVF